MNIFYLNLSPQKTAAQYIPKHLVKMPLETAQILCTAFPAEISPYKHTHYNHPCCKWARESSGNFLWLAELGLEICKQYTKKYGREHASQKVIEWCILNYEEEYFPDFRFSEPPICMPEEFIVEEDAIASYQNYYEYKRQTIGV